VDRICHVYVTAVVGVGSIQTRRLCPATEEKYEDNHSVINGSSAVGVGVTPLEGNRE